MGKKERALPSTSLMITLVSVISTDHAHREIHHPVDPGTPSHVVLLTFARLIARTYGGKSH